MRHSILLLSILFVSHVFGQSSLTIEVEVNRPKDGGTVRLAVCKGADAYVKEKGCIVATGRVVGSLVRIEVKDLPEGEYAIKAFHDVNDNGEMDFNWAGIPKEPYGFSNNATGTMAAPKFSQAAFKVRPGANVTRFRMRG